MRTSNSSGDGIFKAARRRSRKVAVVARNATWDRSQSESLENERHARVTAAPAGCHDALAAARARAPLRADPPPILARNKSSLHDACTVVGLRDGRDRVAASRIAADGARSQPCARSIAAHHRRAHATMKRPRRSACAERPDERSRRLGAQALARAATCDKLEHRSSTRAARRRRPWRRARVRTSRAERGGRRRGPRRELRGLTLGAGHDAGAEVDADAAPGGDVSELQRVAWAHARPRQQALGVARVRR